MSGIERDEDKGRTDKETHGHQVDLSTSSRTRHPDHLDRDHLARITDPDPPPGPRTTDPDELEPCQDGDGGGQEPMTGPETEPGVIQPRHVRPDRLTGTRPARPVPR